MKQPNKNILIYYSSGLMSIDLLSLMIELKKVGYNLYFLTNSAKGSLHEELERNSIKTYTKEYNKNIFSYLKHATYLARFTKKHKIDIVYSHIQVNNFISTIAQYLSPSKFYMCRHHSDYVWNGKVRKAKIMDKVINRFSKNIVAISDKVYDQLIQVEGVAAEKVHQINLGYDFSLYPKPNLDSINKIKNELNCDFRILNIGRMIPLKRQLLLVKACEILIKKGINLKLVILGDGEERKKIESYVIEHNLAKSIILKGYVGNVIDYISASDIIVHPSESEASSTISKEVALENKTLIACEGVGDFDNYLNKFNGYLISKNQTSNSLANEIEFILKNKSLLNEKGVLLNKTIINKFSIDKVIPSYQKLFL